MLALKDRFFNLFLKTLVSLRDGAYSSAGREGDAEFAGVENAGMEIVAPECKAGNRGRRKSMESERFKNVFLTILTENRVLILTCLAYTVECNV